MIEVTQQISAVSGRSARAYSRLASPHDDDQPALPHQRRRPVGRVYLPSASPAGSCRSPGDLQPRRPIPARGQRGGTIERCDPPKSFAATWEFGGMVSWIEVGLSAEPGAGRGWSSCTSPTSTMTCGTSSALARSASAGTGRSWAWRTTCPPETPAVGPAAGGGLAGIARGRPVHGAEQRALAGRQRRRRNRGDQRAKAAADRCLPPTPAPLRIAAGHVRSCVPDGEIAIEGPRASDIRRCSAATLGSQWGTPPRDVHALDMTGCSIRRSPLSPPCRGCSGGRARPRPAARRLKSMHTARRAAGRGIGRAMLRRSRWTRALRLHRQPGDRHMDVRLALQHAEPASRRCVSSAVRGKPPPPPPQPASPSAGEQPSEHGNRDPAPHAVPFIRNRNDLRNYLRSRDSSMVDSHARRFTLWPLAQQELAAALARPVASRRPATWSSR